MTGLLISQRFFDELGPEVGAVAEKAGMSLEPLILGAEQGTPLDAETCARIEIAYESSDLRYGNRAGFYRSIRAATNLRWLHIFAVGMESERLDALLARNVRVTNSVGVNAEPVALTAITGVLTLSRGFPHWMALQRERSWRPWDVDDAGVPSDLKGETMVVIGMGAIGARIAEIGRVLGLRVIGVRRGPPTGREPVDEMVGAADLDSVLPAADWLVLAPALTPETSGMIDARRLAMLPHGARIVNISRGAVVDEPAMIEGLSSGRIGGAYLDVFVQEPLPAESPLWEMANVIVSPHNAALSRGKYRREADLFLDNLMRWGEGRDLLNEVGGR